MRIVALKYGESILAENYIFEGGDKKKFLPISFTIYLIQTEGKNILVDAGCDDGAGFKMSVFKKPVEVLREYGLDAADITDVVITHAHHDHIEAVGYYKKAVIHIQKDEYEREGRKYISDSHIIRLFDDECQVAKGVTVKKIGGHAKGSSIVVADNWVICGDECYYQRCFTDKIITGSSVCPEKSRTFIEEYGSDKYHALIMHDPSIMPGQVGFEIFK